MDERDLLPDERAMLDAYRRSQRREEPRLRLVTTDELRRLLKTRVGLGPLSIRQTIERLGLVTQRHDGPLVVITGTLTDLKASWRLHQDDLIARGKSGPVIRHRREAVARFCRALELDWTPAAEPYEIRSRAAREARGRIVELPEDFLDRVDAVVRGVEYHPNADVNAGYQVRARTAFKTAPRTPSEDGRLRTSDVLPGRRVIVYRQSKIAGPETAVLIPREVFEVPDSVLSSPVHMSLRNYELGARARLVAKLPKAKQHDIMYVGARGGPMNGERFRFWWGLFGRKVWPDFYPYISREIGIIMRAVEMIFEEDHLDLERLMQWTGHVEISTLRHYIRKGRSLVREAGGRSDLKIFVQRWREI